MQKPERSIAADADLIARLQAAGEVGEVNATASIDPDSKPKRKRGTSRIKKLLKPDPTVRIALIKHKEADGTIVQHEIRVPRPKDHPAPQVDFNFHSKEYPIVTMKGEPVLDPTTKAPMSKTIVFGPVPVVNRAMRRMISVNKKGRNHRVPVTIVKVDGRRVAVRKVA